MKDVFKRYQAGEVTTGADWVDDLENAWTLTADLDAERAVAQIGLFDGDHYYRKVHPVIELTPEQEHFLRPPDTREGRRLAEVRNELRQFDGARGLPIDQPSLNAGEL